MSTYFISTLHVVPVLPTPSCIPHLPIVLVVSSTCLSPYDMYFYSCYLHMPYALTVLATLGYMFSHMQYMGARWLLEITILELNLIPGFYTWLVLLSKHPLTLPKSQQTIAHWWATMLTHHWRQSCAIACWHMRRLKLHCHQTLSVCALRQLEISWKEVRLVDGGIELSSSLESGQLYTGMSFKFKAVGRVPVLGGLIPCKWQWQCYCLEQSAQSFQWHHSSDLRGERH